MRKRLIVHIGVHKTGTTSAQQTFFDNAGQLAAYGILYPKFYEGSDSAIHHQTLAWQVIEAKVNYEDLRKWAESLSRMDAHTVILSAEDFSKAKDLRFLACFGDLFEVEVVVYLKRQDKWITSWYNQHVKWPFHERFATCTPNEFLGYLGEFYWIQYFETIDRWAKAVGKHRVRIRVMEKGQVQDPVADLLDICGVDFVLEKNPSARQNESLPAAQIKLLRDIGGLLRYSPDVRYKVQRAAMMVPVPSGSEVYPKAVRRMLMERYASGNEMVAEYFLGRSDRTLFYDNEMDESPGSHDDDPDGEQLFCFARSLIEVFSADVNDTGTQRAMPRNLPAVVFSLDADAHSGASTDA